MSSSLAEAAPAERPTREAARLALLHAGTEIFLQSGLRAARVQDIAAAAGVRLSAINYHFGGKEGLYHAVLQHHADLALSYAPFPLPVAGFGQEQRLRLLVRALVSRFLDPANPSRLGALLLREAANPTGALDMLFARYAQQQSQLAFAFLRECLPDADPDLLARTLLSVIGQVIVYVAMAPMVARLRPSFDHSPEALQQLSDHIATFAWAGIQALHAATQEQKS